jgi:UDP:flavonoid glycosyltransferase YjiC (YdhE family)
VLFAGQAAVLPRLAELGFGTTVVGPDTLADERLPLVPLDREAERAVMRDHFVGRHGTQRAVELAALCEQERPCLVLCDEVDVGSVVVCERLDIPCVTVSVIAAGRLISADVVGEAWNRLRHEHGLADDPSCERLGGTLRLAPAPSSFRDPALPRSDRLHPVRPPILDEVHRVPGSSTPLVYATLGTVFNVESGDLLDRLARALSLGRLDALMTTGPHVRPDELAHTGANVRVEQFVPQREVLGRCAAVVCHGGSGTLIAALSLGVPVVVLPLGADQPDNADRCAALDAGVVLDPLVADPMSIAAAMTTVIDDARYARAAGRLAAEAAGQPRPEELVELRALLEPTATG